MEEHSEVLVVPSVVVFWAVFHLVVFPLGCFPIGLFSHWFIRYKKYLRQFENITPSPRVTQWNVEDDFDLLHNQRSI